jgi:hypothetical protein
MRESLRHLQKLPDTHVGKLHGTVWGSAPLNAGGFHAHKIGGTDIDFGRCRFVFSHRFLPLFWGVHWFLLGLPSSCDLSPLFI